MKKVLIKKSVFGKRKGFFYVQANESSNIKKTVLVENLGL